MEFNLSNIHWLDAFTPPVEAQLELLGASVKTHLGRVPEQGPPDLGGGPDGPPSPPWPRAFWPITIAASIFGLVALCILVMAIQARNGEPKTTVSDSPPVRDGKGHANPAADSDGAKPPNPPAPRARIPPEGPARLTRRVHLEVWTVDSDQIIQEDVGVSGFAFGNEGWNDYDFTVAASKSAGPGGLRVDFRLSQGKGLNLEIGGYDNKKHRLIRTSNPSGVRGKGVAIEIQSKPGTIQSLEWYKLKVSLRGPRIRIALDDHLLFDCMDNHSEKGCVGLRCLNSAGRFRNIKVTAPDGTVLWEGPPDLRKE
jgi:hypothetical protein